MTIETQTNKVQYLGNGVATVFPVNFPVRESGHLRLFIMANGSQAEMITGFEVTGIDSATVSVVLDSPLPTGALMTILREVPLVQPMSLSNAGDFNAKTLEESDDNLAMQIQQIKEMTDRAVVAPESMNAGEVTYETLVNLKNSATLACDDAQAAASDAAGAASSAKVKAI